MQDIDKEVLSHIPPKTKTLIEKLFKTSVEDFYEKLLNLETDELILSIPININIHSIIKTSIFQWSI